MDKAKHSKPTNNKLHWLCCKEKEHSTAFTTECVKIESVQTGKCCPLIYNVRTSNLRAGKEHNIQSMNNRVSESTVLKATGAGAQTISGSGQR